MVRVCPLEPVGQGQPLEQVHYECVLLWAVMTDSVVCECLCLLTAHESCRPLSVCRVLDVG